MIKDIVLKKARGEAIYDTEKEFKQYLMFKLGDLDFLLDTSYIVELLDLIEITQVPGAPFDMLGIINLRGRIATIFDLRNILGIKEVWRSDLSRIVIINLKNELLGIFVDEAQKMVNVDISLIYDNETESTDCFYSEYAVVDEKKLFIVNMENIIFNNKNI